MTITRYRKGQLSVPYLYCPEIDTLVGELRLNQTGIARLVIGAGNIRMYRNVLLSTNYELQDASENPLIAGDNAGNVDQLGRIDAPVTSPTDAHVVIASPAELINSAQSGTIDEDKGSWTVTADDMLYLFLGQVLDFLHIQGNVRIDSAIVHFNTDHNDVYITNMYFYQIDCITGTASKADEDNDDYGNGSTGNENAEFDVGYTLLTGKLYRLDIDCEATAGTMIIRSITIKYHLV